MKKWLKLGALATALALLTVLALSVSAFAKGSGPGPAPYNTTDYGSQRGLSFPTGTDWHGPQNSLIAVAASVLGMSQADLMAELDNKTLAQVAQEKGVAPEKIVDAFLAPRIATLQSQVDAGKLTQAQADQMIATMKARVTAQLTSVWTPRGPGYGHGFIDADHDGICDAQQ